MSNQYNQGGWNGGYQQGGGGFAAHNVQHRYQEDDFSGGYPNQSQSQRNQAPLYARGNPSYQRGSTGHNYGSHRGHPQMGGHQQQRKEHHQYPQNMNGYGNVNGWQHQSQSSRGGPPPSSSHFGGFNPNAAVFTPGGNFASGNDLMMSLQQPMNQFRPNSGGFHTQPYFNPGMQSSYSDGLDEETAAYEAMYSNQQEPAQFMPSQELNSLIASDPQGVRIQEVLIGLEQLISDPSDYESWSGAIRERTTTMNDVQRSICVRIMLEMLMSCSADPSFPMHSAVGTVMARLLDTMAREVPSSVPNAILPTLHLFHTNRSEYGLTERASLMVLMGELFDRIETGKGSKVEVLGNAIMDLMREMLKPDAINEMTMKELCYTAKTVGPGLDSISTLKTANDDLLTTLSAFGKGHPKLSECMKNEIAVLIEQREAGWPSRLHGVSSYGQLSSLGGAASSSSSSSVPVGSIIGADGKALNLSEEERNFLEEQFGGDDDVDDMYAEMEKFVREEDEKKERELTNKMMEKLKICGEKEKDQE